MEKKINRVLALKYRPKNFKELIGQDIIVETITNAIKGHCKAPYLGKVPRLMDYTVTQSGTLLNEEIIEYTFKDADYYKSTGQKFSRETILIVTMCWVEIQ